VSINDPNAVNKVAANISLNVDPALAELQKLKTALDDTLGSSSVGTRGARSSGDQFLAGADGAIRTVRQQIQELELQFKEGSLAAQDLYDKLVSLRTAYSNAFDTTTSNGLINDTALRKAIVSAESQISKYQDFQMNGATAVESRQEELTAQELQKYNESVDAKVKQVKLLHDLQMQSAQDSLDQLSVIYVEDADRFAADVDKKTQMLKTMYTYEKEAAAQSAAAMNPVSGSSASKSSGSSHYNGVVGITGMATMMAEFTGLSMLMQNVQEGLVGISKQQQGLEQVFGNSVQGQQQLNQVTNEFIDIAKQYGTSVQDVLDAGKQWGRQYKDVNTALTLTRNSTLLAIVDNLQMADANKAVEATMNAMGMAATNQASAMTNSMRIVDSWSALAHEASVSANDLAAGVERSAGAARQAGLSIDQLNALIAAGVRNTGLSGDNVGNMWKSVLASISAGTPKVQKAFQELGISLTETGANGQKVMKPVYQVILDLSTAAQHATASQTQYFEAIAGGKYQYSKLMSAISDTKTIQDDYNKSLNSTGKANQYATEQMHTLSAELIRLKDSIQQLAYNAGSGGLGDVLTGLVTHIADLVNGLQKLPASVDWTAAGFVGLLLTGKALTSMFNTAKSAVTGIYSGFNFFREAIASTSGAIVNMTGASAALTADLNAKVIATEADVAANEAEVVSVEEATVALEAEGAAADVASTSFFTLDAAMAGATLGLSILLPILAVVVMNMGKQKDAAIGATQSAQQLTQAIQAQTQADMQAAQQTETNVGSLQQLKQQYVDTLTAINNAKAGSSAYQQAQAELITIHQQLAKVVGEAAAAEILGSKNIAQAFNDEASAMIKAQIVELQAKQALADGEFALTTTVIEQTSKRIEAYQTEADAIAATQSKINSGPLAGRFGVSPNGSALDGSNQSGAYLSGNENSILRNMQLKNRQIQQSIINQQGSGADPYQLEIDKLKSALNDPNPGSSFGNIPGISSGGAAGTSASKGSGASAYKAPFQDLAQNDDQAMKVYDDRIKAIAASVSAFSDAMKNADAALKANNTDTTAAAQLVKGYNGEVASLKSQISAYNAESAKVNQLLPQVERDIKNVNAQFAAGTITDQEHRDALSTLNAEYDRLKQKLDDNAKAVIADNQAIATSTQTITSEITSMLQTAYQDQQSMQDDALTNTYQPQIDALNAQKTAIDGVISSLQAQWSAQDAVNQLSDLQNQLLAVQADKRFEIVGLDGKLSYTYDTAKATDLQKQIADQQTKMAHDAQIAQLNDQKTALDAEIKNLQDAYNEKKKQLDDYWKWKLSTDQINQDADNLILKDGLTGALSYVQTYTTQMIDKYNALQAAAAAAGQGIAAGLGGSGVSAGAGSGTSAGASSTGKTYSMADKNGHVDTGTSINALVNQHGGQWEYGKWVNGHYDSSGQFLHMSTGGEVPLNMGTPNMDSVPAMLTPGEIVVPSWDHLLQGMKQVSNSASTTIHVSGNLEFPNIKGAGDAEAFLADLTEMVGVHRV